MSRWGQRVFGSVFVIFAGVAMLLAVIGLYAVTAYAVSQRTREFGVRIALGARTRQIQWLVARRVSRQIGAGLLIGGMGALAVSRAVPAMLGGARGNDPLTLLAVTALLLAAAACACVIPARRAAHLEPTVALRAD
jgi:ABC-type antimicrobial peptide transport system permease subunit